MASNKSNLPFPFLSANKKTSPPPLKKIGSSKTFGLFPTQSGGGEEDQVTIVVGIEDLETLDSFCSDEDYTKKNRKDFAPVKLNAVVVDT